MDFPIHIDTISVELSIVYFKGSHVEANSADPDEMQHYAAFHLGLHCLPKYLFTRPVYKGLKNRPILSTHNIHFGFETTEKN